MERIDSSHIVTGEDLGKIIPIFQVKAEMSAYEGQDHAISIEPTDEELNFAKILSERNGDVSGRVLDFLVESDKIKKDFGYLDPDEFEKLKQKFNKPLGQKIASIVQLADVIPISSRRKIIPINEARNRRPKTVRYRSKLSPSQNHFRR